MLINSRTIHKFNNYPTIRGQRQTADNARLFQRTAWYTTQQHHTPCTTVDGHLLLTVVSW